MKLALVLLSVWLVGSVPIGILVGTVLKRRVAGFVAAPVSSVPHRSPALARAPSRPVRDR